MSTQITVTEALQEIKTINARIAKKQENVIRYFARDASLKDPLLKKEGDVGSAAFIKQERQGITDLEGRIVAIRTAIQKKNLATTLTLHNISRSVAEWLTWRREVAPRTKGFMDQMIGHLNRWRDEAQRRGKTVTKDQNTAAENEVIININDLELMEDVQRIEQLLGDLDGKLSLLNATMLIEID